MLTCEWSENLEIRRESGSLANGTPLLGAGGLSELIWSSKCFQLPCCHLSHACDSAGMGWGARASTGLGQAGSSLRTSTWLGGSVVLGVKEQEQGESSWEDLEGPWRRQPGGQGHVIGGGGGGLRSQKYSSCDLELPLFIHVVLIRLYNFLSLFKF